MAGRGYSATGDARAARLRAAWAMCCCLGCARDVQMDQWILRVGHAIVDAESSGALRCAPRELAVARSQLRFAELERTQGFASKADTHLRSAERHALAAKLLSPAEHCLTPPAERADGPTSCGCAPTGSACGSR
jgi:OmpA-OmpF porin, OOP family